MAKSKQSSSFTNKIPGKFYYISYNDEGLKFSKESIVETIKKEKLKDIIDDNFLLNYETESYEESAGISIIENYNPLKINSKSHVWTPLKYK